MNQTRWAARWLTGWRSFAHIGGDLLLATPYLLLVCLVLVGVCLVPVVVGVPVLIGTLWLCARTGAVERARVRDWLGVDVPTPAPRTVRGARAVLRPDWWRAFGHLFLVSLWGVLAGPVLLVLASVALALAALPGYGWALPAGRLDLLGVNVTGVLGLTAACLTGLGILIVLPFVSERLAGVDIGLARALLGPSRGEEVTRLHARVQDLTASRSATVDSVEAERRRIERDLHDGPQQQLVALAMDLGRAKARLAKDPAGALALIDDAHLAAKEAMAEIRQVARGLHPPVLTDRGLDAALSAVAARSPVPVTVRADLPTRPDPTIEAIAYFCVCEALTNIAKHAGASSAQVALALDGQGVLLVQVSDDGRGGAHWDGPGTGLRGLRDRVAAVDGRLTLSSPPGGPTDLVIMLPVRLRDRS